MKDVIGRVCVEQVLNQNAGEAEHREQQVHHSHDQVHGLGRRRAARAHQKQRSHRQVSDVVQDVDLENSQDRIHYEAEEPDQEVDDSEDQGEELARGLSSNYGCHVSPFSHNRLCRHPPFIRWIASIGIGLRKCAEKLEVSEVPE